MANEFIKVGQELYNDEGFHSENVLTEAGLLKGDDLTSVLTYLNEHIRNESPFMWLNAGQGGYSSKELEGDGQYFWDTIGEIKEHDEIIGSPYSSTDRPGYQGQEFLVYQRSKWIKEGWLVRFKDGTAARVCATPEDKGVHILYKYQLIDPDPTAYCSVSNLTAGNLVREEVYIVPNIHDIGTESNSQTPAKRTNQISKVRFSESITGNIANKKVNWFVFPEEMGGDSSTKYWVDYAWWVAQAKNEKKLERFLFEISLYNRDINGRILLKDHRAANQPIMMGASVKQQIHAEGNYSGYGDSFSMNYWERTVGDITYGLNKSVDIIAYAGTEYMKDFSNAIKRESSYRGYVEAEGLARVTKTSSGLSFDNMKYTQYKTENGSMITFIHMPFLDAAGVSEQQRHPRTGKPISSHSAYYIMQGLDSDNGSKNVVMISEKGEAKVQGLYRGLTNLPKSWGATGTNSNMSMIDLATERNEASIHERRSVGVQLRDTRYTFHHFCDINDL